MAKQNETIHIDHNGSKVSLREACGIIKCSYSKIYLAVSEKDCKSVNDVIAWFEYLASGGKFKDMKRRQYQTKHGLLTMAEIYDIHPYKDEITKATISGRMCRREGMCPSLWWGSMLPSKFKSKLIELGLIEPYKRTPAKKKTKLKFDKSKTCYRDKFTIKCSHYLSLSDSFDGTSKFPDKCKEALGDKCPNFYGNRLEPMWIDRHGSSTGRLSEYTGRGERRDKRYLKV